MSHCGVHCALSSFPFFMALATFATASVFNHMCIVSFYIIFFEKLFYMYIKRSVCDFSWNVDSFDVLLLTMYLPKVFKFSFHMYRTVYVFSYLLHYTASSKTNHHIKLSRVCCHEFSRLGHVGTAVILVYKMIQNYHSDYKE